MNRAHAGLLILRVRDSLAFISHMFQADLNLKLSMPVSLFDDEF